VHAVNGRCWPFKIWVGVSRIQVTWGIADVYH